MKIMTSRIFWGTLALLASVQSAHADIKADADIILNWAEKTFPDLLSPNQPTNLIEDWSYRNYPKSDLYVGINLKSNNVYYISGVALSQGLAPTLYNSVAATLKLATEATSNTAGGTCDTSKLPAGHTFTQTGSTIKITTNGCVVAQTANPELCPKTVQSGGASLLQTLEATITKDTSTIKSSLISCVINTADTTNKPIIEFDVCYQDKTNTQKTQRSQGQMRFAKVDDCFKTDAAVVTDLVTGALWFKTPSGFVSANK